VAVLLIAAESLALHMFPDPPSGKGMKLGDCLMDRGPISGIRAVPDSVCHGSLWESNMVEYRFNHCGDRDDKECYQKPAGTYRIVVLGTSTALGWSVQREQSFVAILPKEIERRTGRNVDVYNESMMFQSPTNILDRFDEILSAKPNMILWTYPPIQPLNSSAEMRDAGVLSPTEEEDTEGILPTVVQRTEVAFARQSIPHAVHDLLMQLEDSRIQFMIRHYLNQSQTKYLSSYLNGEEAGFLKTESFAGEENKLQGFEDSVAKIASRSKAAGVPLVVVMLPFRAQIAMIAMRDWPAGYDPYRLDNEMRAIVERHGATYISILSDYQKVANPEKAYFPVDGHPMPEGHAMLAKLLAKELTSGSVPSLTVTTSSNLKSE
jgi:hypothetical protein